MHEFAPKFFTSQDYLMAALGVPKKNALTRRTFSASKQPGLT